MTIPLNLPRVSGLSISVLTRYSSLYISMLLYSLCISMYCYYTHYICIYMFLYIVKHGNLQMSDLISNFENIFQYTPYHLQILLYISLIY